MRTAARLLVIGWLLAALLVLALDGRLGAFLAVVAPGSLVALGLGSEVRRQLAPSRFNRPQLPEPYRLADDVGVPLAVVVAAAERAAMHCRK
jgi:hypothetical protein